MNSLFAEGRSLSLVILLPATAIFAVMLIMVLSRTASQVTRYLVFALWLRWVLSAYHDITFDPSPLGLSWNALGSVAVIGLGLFVIKARRILDPVLVPIYVMFAAILASGAVNHAWAGAIDFAVKYTYLAVLAMAIVDAIEEVGIERLTRLALWPFAVPLGLQILSVVLGASKATEADGSVSYIGGYNHEAAFSMCLASGLVLVCMARGLSAGLKVLLAAVCYVGIYLANYRTAILAMTPLVGVAVVAGVTSRILPAQRALVAGAMALTVGVAGAAGFLLNAERFADISIALEQGPALIKPVEHFTVAERRLMSGRLYIWSDYLFSYADAKPIQHVVGLGPNAWEGRFNVYAHNTIVSYIYELGAFGLFAVLFLWGWMIGLAARVTDGSRWLLIGGHISFFIFNMATMPLWNIEGLILYALLCGFTVAGYRASRMARQNPAPDHQLGWGRAAGGYAQPR